MNRRGFIGSILLAATAPAIVRADSLMRVIPTGATILLDDLREIPLTTYYDLVDKWYMKIADKGHVHFYKAHFDGNKWTARLPP